LLYNDDIYETRRVSTFDVSGMVMMMPWGCYTSSAAAATAARYSDSWRHKNRRAGAGQ